MAERNSQIEEEAIAWLMRLRDAGADEWEDFTLWLEADPAHAAAYEEAALADQGLDELAPAAPLAPAPANDEPSLPGRSTRRTVLGWGIAAAIAGVIGFSAIQPSNSVYAVETGAGERRTVELADGSRIDLNGSTRLLLDRDRTRYAELERGEALFTVAHDDARPFEVEAGGALLRDMGTVFNVVRQDETLEVGVAEGAVLFNPEAEAVELTPGMSLRSAPGEDLAVVRGEPQAIAGWREGRLSYAAAPVAEVAADLSRNLGVPVAAVDAVAARPFSGLIRLERRPEEDIGRAAQLMGLSARRSAAGWVLTKGAGETP